jgi:hypothetical protein
VASWSRKLVPRSERVSLVALGAVRVGTRLRAVIRRFLGTHQGLLLIVLLEGLLLVVALPRVLRNGPAVLYFVAFFGLATVFYFSNYRVWRWLRSSN